MIDCVMWFKSKNIPAGVIVSIWTIVQTSFHVLWTLSGYYFYDCTIKPSHYWFIMIYLTYFYNRECGELKVDDDFFDFNFLRKTSISSEENESDLHYIVQTIVDKAQLPEKATYAERTFVYLKIYLAVDALWLITTVLLLIGTWFQVKRRLSLLFYSPWLIITAVVALLDVAAAVHYGVDMLKIHNYTSWMKFIGISNYGEFASFDDFESSSIVPYESSIILCVLFARFFIFWIINVYNFSQIMNVAVLAYENYADEAELEAAARKRRRKAADATLNLDTSESRIRNWQLFYGATDTVSITSTISSKSTPTDLNSNKRAKKTSVKIDPIPRTTDDEETLSSIDMYLTTIPISPNNIEGFGNTNSNYRRISDIEELVETHSVKKPRHSSVDSLRGQLPWSYIKPNNEDKPRETDKGYDFVYRMPEMSKSNNLDDNHDNHNPGYSNTAL